MKKLVIRILTLGSLIITLLVGGGAGYLWTTGMVDGPKLERILAVVQGTDAAAEPPETPEAPAPVEESGAVVERKQINDEVAWRNYMRRMAELEQRKTVVDLEMLRVEKAREAFTREKELVDQQLRARKQLDQTQGFQKELELVAQMKPKQALEYLLAKAPEDAAHMILRLNERSAKGIVQSARSTEEKTRLNEILELMKEMSVESDAAAAPPGRSPQAQSSSDPSTKPT